MNARALSRRAFPYFVVAAGGFLLSYLFLFFFAFPSDVLPDDGRIPRVVGMDFDKASADLEKAGFHSLKGQTRFHKTTPEGIVLEQDPPAGSVQKRGAEVTLVVSAGQANATVPEVRGVTQQQAQVAIENAGFTFGSISQQTSNEPRGAVIASDPPPGTTLDLPATVSITLSQGPASVQLPDLTGRTLADARSALEQLGLHLGGTSRDTSSFMPENTVLSQAPSPGATVSAGSSVNLRISQFPPPPRLGPPDSIRIDSIAPGAAR
ncbi:MAG TPA: PASTA domain-containing protein [Gemmatimonadaceae bacterium]|nr:PASTA domain-containing protein [Gemmatimonadaceae bacterium]